MKLPTPPAFWPRLAAYGPLAVVLLLAWDAAVAPRGLASLTAAVAILLACARRTSRGALVLAGSLVALEAGARLHLYLQGRTATASAHERIGQRLAGLESRKEELIRMLGGAARHVAGLPETEPALHGDRAALARLFTAMETWRNESLERPALAVIDGASGVVAWSGRMGEFWLPDARADGPDVFVVEGRVSTTLAAIVPVHPGEGARAGWAVAALPVAVRRNIRNEFLHDFDLLTGTDPRIEIRYVDYRTGLASLDRFPPLDPALLGREARLLAPDGEVLAVVRVAAPGIPELQKALFARYQRLLAVLAVVAVLAWAAGRTRSPARWALAAVAARAALALLGSPVPGPDSPLLSPDLYASSLPYVAPLLRSPLDLLLTALTLAVLAALLAGTMLRSAGDGPLRALVAWAGTWLVLRGLFHVLADAVVNCSLDLIPLTLLPRSLPHLVMHLALLLLAGAAVMAAAALHAWAAPRTALARAAWAGAGLVALAALTRPLSPGELRVPAALTVALGVLVALLGAAAPRWRPRLEARAVEARAGLAFAAAATVVAFLHAWLFAAVEQDTRARIQSDHANDVRYQPLLRQHVLEQTQRSIDALHVLEETPPGPRPPGIEELAFAVWSATDLAGFGFSSAVEIQDPSGNVTMSRFALNLPSLATLPPLPANESWRLTDETLTLASAQQRVLHARRLLVYDGAVKGAIHVYLAEDFWNLSFLRGRDPYSVLFRTASLGAARDRPLTLVAYGPGGEVAFSSAERPPAAPPPGPGGAARWTQLTIDGQPRHAYVFADHGNVYVLAYPRTSAGQYAADLVEAVAAFALIALVALLALMLFRTALRRPWLTLPSLQRAVAQRFALRLFVVLSVLAFVPVAVLETVVRRFVAERLRHEAEEQALERAAVARKAVEDFVFFQQGESGPREPVTDAALVWVSSVVRNDLDVFEDGRLVASSKRELYDSGLLAPRVSGAVYRSLALDGQPASLRPERIGAFSYLVASVPLRLGGRQPAVLSLPLASRQRELEATVQDLDRTIRLASVVFFALAALLAHSLSRRISDPIRQLTEATRRVAQGDLATRVSATSQDELQRLVESFNQMAGDLDRQRRDLERSNRLAAWAEMARQVAHEVKNPLTPIQLSAEHLRRVWRDGGADFGAVLESCTHTILRQVRTLRGMVTEFSAFARPPAPELQAHDLAALIEEVMAPYRQSPPPGVEVALERPADALPVEADRRLLERAVVNLLENALQAVDGGGRIVVRVRRGAEAARAEIEVEDSGPGIDPEVRDRIFEPFFSTKTGGSGLGLALVRKIAEDHGGGVGLESGPGGGTRARLWLPALSVESPGTPAGRSAAAR